MSQRYWTADFHLSMTDIIRFEERPFQDIQQMDDFFIQQCKKLQKDDVIVHVGDLYSFKNDRNFAGGQKKPIDLLDGIAATFINIRGNHDLNNKVKSLCESMRVRLGKSILNVSVSHYPSYDKRAIGNFLKYDIHLCGHVHRKWRHCLDVDNHVLNINVGVDVWNYNILDEDQLIRYINKVLNLPNDKLLKVKNIDGKIVRC